MQHTTHARPEPLTVPWELKPMSSARTGAEALPDGRMRFWIKHDLLKGVTPAMLAWWFSNLEGDVDIEGRLLNRRGRHGSNTTSRRSAASRTSSPTSTAGRSASSRLRPLPEEVTRASLR